MGKINVILKKHLSGSRMWQVKLYNYLLESYVFLCQRFISDERFLKRMYRKAFNKELNLSSPQTLNEKLQWLKLNVHDDIQTLCADKYEVRSFIAKEFGEEYLIPLLYSTSNYKDLTPNNIPDEDCIIKSNHGCADYTILRGKEKERINYPLLQEKYRHALRMNHYGPSREWQYKNIIPLIIIEKLLVTKEGKIPNDYKLHFINGEFQFVYVSYDREGINDRCIFDADWIRLPFMWIESYKFSDNMNTTDVPRPKSFDKMIAFGTKIAKRFKYVRVDFYDVDGKLYFGEITLHHGSGCDAFFPEKYDTIYGKLLKLDA